MNTKGIKFLAVLAVLAMAFAVFAVVSDTEQDDAATARGYQGYSSVSYVPTAGEKTAPVAVIVDGSTITGYESLDDAITAATAGQTVILVADQLYTAAHDITIGKNLTVDLNGKSIKADAKSLSIAIDDLSGNARTGGFTVEFKNGVINAKHMAGGDKSVFSFGTGTAVPLTATTLKITNCQINTNGCAVYTQVQKTVLTMDQTTVVSTGYYGIATNASNDATGVTWTIKNSDVSVDNDDGTAIMFNIRDSITIDNTKITGTDHCVMIRNGAATLKDSSLVYDVRSDLATNNGKAYGADKEYGDGNRVPYAAIFVGDRNTGSYTGPETLTIENVDITTKDSRPLSMKEPFATIWVESGKGNGDAGDDLATLNIKGTLINSGEPFVMFNYGGVINVESTGTLSIDAQGSLLNDNGRVIGDNDASAKKGKIDLAGSIVNAGEIDNNNEIAVNTASPIVGKTGIVGAGTIVNNSGAKLIFNTSQTDITKQPCTNSIKTMNGGAVCASAFEMISPNNSEATNYGIRFADTDAAGYILSTFNGVSGTTYTLTTWPGWTYAINANTSTKTFELVKNDVVNIVEGNKLSVTAAITVPAGATVNIMPLATLAMGTNLLTNSGTIDMKEGAVVSGSMVAGSNAIKTNGKEVEQEDAANTKAIEDAISKAATDGNDVVINVTDTSDAVEATVKSNDVTLVGKAGVSLTNIDITVEGTATSSKALTISGFESVSGKITTKDGSSTQSVTLTGFTGTIKVTRGSIIIDGVDYGGTITVDAGTELKLSGTVKSDLTINYNDPEDTEVAAKVIVESGKGLVLKNGTKMIINNDKISLQVDGTISKDTGAAASIWSCGDITINNGGVVEVTSIIDQNSTPTASQITITVNSGAVLEGAITFTKTTEGESSKLIAYSGSDINGVTTEKAEFFVGKDAEGGEWTVKKLSAAPTYELILSSYNGTYNFYGFEDKITKFTINGVNKVTYAFSEEYEDDEAIILFGGETNKIAAITTDETGSLDIQLDISKVPKDKLFTKLLTVMVVGEATYNINGVDLSISVTGENATWEKEQTEAMHIKGIVAPYGFKTYNADIVIDIISAYKSKAGDNAIGIDVTGAVVIDNAISVDIKAGGTGIKATTTATFSNSASIVLDGKYGGGLNVTGTKTTIQTVISMEIKTKATTKALDVLASNVKIAGTGEVGAFQETNSSTVTFTGTPKFSNTVNVKMNSILNIKNATINGTVTNDGILNITGDVVVSKDKEVKNNSVMTNSGLIGVYGKFTNNGAFNNTGTIEIYKYGFVNDAAKEFVIGSDKVPTAAGNARVKSIELLADAANTTFKADGSAKVKATVTFVPNVGSEFTGTFSGILTPGLDGSYTLALDNSTTEDAATATITLKYVIAKPADTKIGGTQYTLSVTGTVKNGDDVFYLATNDAAATVSTDDIVYNGKITDSGASIATSKDSVIVNEGKFIISSGAPEIKGVFTGALVTNTDDTTISGIITGNVTANGEGTFTVVKDATVIGAITTKADVVVNKDGSIGGNITTEKGVNATGGIIGNITAKNSVTVTDLLGNITVNANGPKNVTVKGDMLGDIIYVSKYKATPEAKAGEETEYTAKMHVDAEANGDGFTIILAAGSDATSSAAVVPGFFKINNTMVDLETGDIVELSLTEGKLYVDSLLVMKTGYYLNIEAGTTIEVYKTAASLDVTAAALKVSNEATANFETGSATPVNYGKVLFIMSFETAAGYKMYSDVAYALSNCDEGSELTLGVSSAINTNVSVPDGVNIIVDSVTLSFNGMDVKMGEDAKITLKGTGELVFKKSGDNTLTVKEDEEYEYYSVTACIVSGDNHIDLNKVRFTKDGNSIKGVAATASEPAKFDVDFQYNEGAIIITAGNAIGDIALENYEYYLTKADKKAEKLTEVFGVLTVAEGAVFELENFSDEMEVATLDKDGEVDITSYPTMVTGTGTIKILKNLTVKGVFLLGGSIELADDVVITIDYGNYLDYEKKIFYGPAFTATVFDKLDNGFGLKAVVALPYKAAGADPATDPAKDGKAFTIKADKTNECITFGGDIFVGIIDSVTADSAVLLDKVTIHENASIEAEAVTINGENIVNGFAKILALTKKTGASLVYEVVYIDGLYTVYSLFKNIDFDYVSEITLTKSLKASDMTDKTKLDLSEHDVNITIAKGETLTLDKIMIIGTPITVLGDEGSSIVGKVIIQAKNYLVAYSDVDLSEAEIVYEYEAGKYNDAVFSKLDVEENLYAVICAGEDQVKLSKADAALIPEIVGYNFTTWVNYNGDVDANVGETNAYADAKAVPIYITIVTEKSAIYKVNGSTMIILDSPFEVPIGTVVNATPADGYQGETQTWVVIDDMTIKATAFQPIPEPAPEPVVGDSGLSLTDILLIVLVILIAIMVVILVLRLNRS
jgi:hypothetical protein